MKSAESRLVPWKQNKKFNIFPASTAAMFRSMQSHKNIFDVKICAKYIFSYVIFCKNGFERVNSAKLIHS